MMCTGSHSVRIPCVACVIFHHFTCRTMADDTSTTDNLNEFVQIRLQTKNGCWTMHASHITRTRKKREKTTTTKGHISCEMSEVNLANDARCTKCVMFKFRQIQRSEVKWVKWMRSCWEFCEWTMLPVALSLSLKNNTKDRKRVKFDYMEILGAANRII